MSKYKNILVTSLLAVLIATILFVSGILVSKRLSSTDGSLNGSDTTIVINHYYDTTIHITQNVYTTNENSVYYKEYDTSLVYLEGQCDSVRRYKIQDGNDSIEIYGDIFVWGTLMDRQLSYKWLLPYKTVETITISKWKSGPIIGVDAMIKPGFVVGIHGGWQTKKGMEYTVGYFTDKSILFSVRKVFNFAIIKEYRKVKRIDNIISSDIL